MRAPFLGPLERLEAVLMATAVDVVLIALPVKSRYAEIQRTIEVCERIGVLVEYPADVFRSARGEPRLDPTGGRAVVALGPAEDDGRRRVKRALDLIGAAAGLVLLSPLLLAIAGAVRLSGPGPVLFVQQRCGRNRRVFPMYKFRTMVWNAEALQADLEHLNEAGGPVFKMRRDPRVTTVGRVLRRTSLDELPQLLNVLLGHMSLVGPRPLPLRDVHRFSTPASMRRFSVRPGMTCLWQVNGRCEVPFDDWVTLDLQYIDRWSLLLDLRILARTVPAVVRGEGAV
jgi:exopolysaccharide biosynthesis polyprenyl glycosylphosphotransferase